MSVRLEKQKTLKEILLQNFLLIYFIIAIILAILFIIAAFTLIPQTYGYTNNLLYLVSI
jgi:hypothetical protein